MSVSRVYALILRQLYLMRGSPARVIPMFAWVAVDIVLWGFLTRYLNDIAARSYNFVPAMLGAVLLWDFFMRVMHGVTTAFFEDVWSRNFLNVFGSPLQISEYVAGLVLTSILTSTVGLLVMVFLASVVFDLSLFTYGMYFVPFVVVLFLFGIALGVVGSAVVLNFGPASEWFIWPLPALLSPFAGVLYPVTVLPPWMRTVAAILPPSYVFEAMRALVQGGKVQSTSLAMSSLLAVGYVILGCWVFKRTYLRAVRTGLVARYSAESVS